jgi:membrane associated rhomboid family serine protease
MNSPQQNHDFKALSPQHFIIPFFLVLLLWFVKYAEFKTGSNWTHLGVFPGKVEGLIGVLTAPAIHADLLHLTNNSFPLLILGTIIYYFYGNLLFRVVIGSWLISGLVVWFIGRPAYHIGFSGVVYAMASFVFISGLIRRHRQLIALSFVVVFMYGSLVWGLFPIEESMSWESHLSGATAGLLLALVYRKMGPTRKVYEWEQEPDYMEIEVDYEEVQAESQPPEQPQVRYIYTPKKETDPGEESVSK